jgi:hypothetical protein
MLGAINSKADAFTASRFNILRVVTGLPFQAGFASQSQSTQLALDRGDPVLATLSDGALAAAFSTVTGGHLLVLELKEALKRPVVVSNNDEDKRPTMWKKLD